MSTLPQLKAPTQISKLKPPASSLSGAISDKEKEKEKEKDELEFQVHTTAAAANPSKRKANPSDDASGVVGGGGGGGLAKKSAARPKLAPKQSSLGTKQTTTGTAQKLTTQKVMAAAAAAEDCSGPPPKKKRAAWDVKGRLEDMEEYSKANHSKLVDSQKLISGLTEKLNEERTQIQELVTFKQSLENQFQMKQMENGEMQGKLREVESRLEEAKISHEKEIDSLKARNKLESEESDRIQFKLKSDLTSLRNDHERVCAENSALKSSLSTQASTLVTLESDARALRMQTESLESTLKMRVQEVTALMSELEAERARVAELEAKLREEEGVRRKLHNTIQELKGNIRVFCRVRPVLDSEANLDALTHIKFGEAAGDDKTLELMQHSETASGQNTVVKTYPFSFDKVFQPSAPQSMVFSEIAQLVQSALDGYNVCIFAYGQTGSGKTYTMEGSPFSSSSEEGAGMIPRAVAQIFECANGLVAKGWVYKFEAQFLEIYNETVRDLLTNTSGGSGGGATAKYEIKHVGGKTFVTDCTVVPVTSGKEVHALLKKAATNRAVAATNSNERSSRSHSVFTLRLSGSNSLTEESCEGVLNLIDLAGSERLSVSGSTGDRLKETQAINKSLSSLGDVIYALGNKDQHVPYRNSKLTYLLQNSLGGNSKTLMFVNVSPLATSLNESLCSLRFATKVNSCQIGTAKAAKKA